jgi:uncharacterized protein (TIGR00730 family)
MPCADRGGRGAGLSRPLIAVFGSSTAREPDPIWTLAHELGLELGRAGADVVTGGYGGAMEACSRGAHQAGAHVVGVTVELFEARGPVNPWVKERHHAPDLFERLRTVVTRADGFAVLPGSVGTLNELFLAWTLVSVGAHPAPPVVLVGAHWERWLEAQRHPMLVPPRLFEHVRVAATAAEGARLATRDLKARTP